MHILIVIDGGSTPEVVNMGAYLSQAVGGAPALLTIIKHETDRKRAEAILTQAVALMGSVEHEPLTLIRNGHPAEEIAREAEEGKYDLIVIGERPPHQLPIHSLRTNIERVAERSICPVLVAHGQIRRLARALVCEAGKHPSVLSRLIDHLAPLVKIIPGFTILHVMSQIAASPNVLGWELEADAAALIERHSPEGQLLEQDLQTLKQLNVKLDAKVRHGPVVDEILAEAKSGDYDLVVIGAHKAEGWYRFLLDDLAHQIITHADRPVLIV